MKDRGAVARETARSPQPRSPVRAPRARQNWISPWLSRRFSLQSNSMISRTRHWRPQSFSRGNLTASGRPVLIAPPLPRPQMGTNVLIAWNCSTEQARVIAFAMPILKRASRVIVLTVEGGAAVPGPTGEQLCRYLQLNGVPAKPLTVSLDGRLTGEVILAHANALGCDLLIKGAYTQSRLRQMIFGGTTRYILGNAELPVLMAH